jgi:hypothetical protein
VINFEKILCFEQNETTNVYNSDPQMSFAHFFTYLSLRTCIDKAGFFQDPEMIFLLISDMKCKMH